MQIFRWYCTLAIVATTIICYAYIIIYNNIWNAQILIFDFIMLSFLFLTFNVHAKGFRSIIIHETREKRNA